MLCIMGKIRNGELAIEGASGMTAFCMVRSRFPCALLPISMIDDPTPRSSLSSGERGLNGSMTRVEARHADNHPKYMSRGDPHQHNIEAIEAIVPPHTQKGPPFDRLIMTYGRHAQEERARTMGTTKPSKPAESDIDVH